MRARAASCCVCPPLMRFHGLYIQTINALYLRSGAHGLRFCAACMRHPCTSCVAFGCTADARLGSISKHITALPWALLPKVKRPTAWLQRVNARYEHSSDSDFCCMPNGEASLSSPSFIPRYGIIRKPPGVVRIWPHAAPHIAHRASQLRAHVISRWLAAGP